MTVGSFRVAFATVALLGLMATIPTFASPAYAQASEKAIYKQFDDA